ncbi:hypothetical protein M407DRAFT_7102 [Tulasnella calospora MUT 4182]|uniref:OPT superfamily oligopeptide transporter n=1 Tax=Tulasnella calospora MUT 4182 TaxID=1051891 RepID=A0A0C3L1Z8_9AGAM|nr:hypothetical protein M407DRAFT_7102 [Tulasnella calospora MUT 4182]
MGSRPPHSTNDTELPSSRNAFSYDVFAFAVPTTPRSPGSAYPSGGERLNETSSSGTLSTPYSSLIATPNSVTRPSNTHSRHDPRTPVSFTSHVSSIALRTASSRPPFAFLPPPELDYNGSSNPSTPLPGLSVSRDRVPSTAEEYQDEKFSRPVDIEAGSASTRSCSKQLSATVGQEDSPYPEVRASVANTDDPDMPTLTFRMWFIGITLCVLRGCLNLFFSLRWPSPAITETLVAILAYPFGKALDRLLPIRYWTIPLSIPLVGGHGFSLNPSPFNIKEHTLIFMMASIAGKDAYGLGMIITTEKDYGIHLGTGFAFLFLLSTEITGFAFAAFGRRLFIYPASVIWPNYLVTSTLMNTLHADEDTPSQGGQMTRYRFFIIGGIGAFLYYFLPDNVVVNQLFGTVTGLGMGLLTFDWNQVAYIKSPLVIPWWASVNIILGFVVFCWILAPVLYYNNVWNMGHLPITGYSAYDRFGLPYDIHRVLTPDKQLNVTAYQEYSPVYLPVTFALTYFVFKTCALQGLSRAISFLEILKLGHYLKIPPYASFWDFPNSSMRVSPAQLLAVVVSVSAQILMKNAIFASVPDICDPNQGLVGTSRQFGKGSVYQFHVYGLVIGALLPIPIWLWQRRYPSSLLRHFNISVFLTASTNAPPATGVNFTSYFVVAFLFQYLLRVRRYKLWAKFNYILSCALEAGTGIAVIVIFLALQLPKGGRISLDWWGNTVWLNTADAVGVPYFTTDPDNGF